MTVFKKGTLLKLALVAASFAGANILSSLRGVEINFEADVQPRSLRILKEDHDLNKLEDQAEHLVSDTMRVKKGNNISEIQVDHLENHLSTLTKNNMAGTGKEVLILRREDAFSVRKKEDLLAKTRKSPYSIDILIVGSKNATKQAQAQRETWASHEAVRHFFLSTEDDDTNPRCSEKWSEEDLLKYPRTCNKKRFWSGIGVLNRLTANFRNHFASLAFLKHKKNPQGWLCAQRRFATSFTSIVQIYAETQSLPDYFIIADDDTYVNIDHVVSQMIREPAEFEAKGKMPIMFPSFETPVVTAGCRVRWPNHMVHFTMPYGGYGTFFSKGSLKALMQPLYCNNTATELEIATCKKLLSKGHGYDYPLDATIGERKYFELGDSLNQVFNKYSRDMEYFCLHSDWFLAYIANFYNISQHTAVGGLSNKFDDQNTYVPENRLHSFKDSEMYRPNAPLTGQCMYSGEEGGTECNANSTVCHRVNIGTLHKLHIEAIKIH